MREVDGKTRQYHAFIAAFIGGLLVFGRYNKINEQVSAARYSSSYSECRSDDVSTTWVICHCWLGAWSVKDHKSQMFAFGYFTVTWSNHGKWGWLTTTTTLHPFNGLFSSTTWVSRHEKGKPFWILLELEIMGWQWHQLDNMQIICTSLQTRQPCTPVPHHSVLTGRMPFLLPSQQHQSTEGMRIRKWGWLNTPILVPTSY